MAVRSERAQAREISVNRTPLRFPGPSESGRARPKVADGLSPKARRFGRPAAGQSSPLKRLRETRSQNYSTPLSSTAPLHPVKGAEIRYLLDTSGLKWQAACQAKRRKRWDKFSPRRPCTATNVRTFWGTRGASELETACRLLRSRILARNRQQCGRTLKRETAGAAKPKRHSVHTQTDSAPLSRGLCRENKVLATKARSLFGYGPGPSGGCKSLAIFHLNESAPPRQRHEVSRTRKKPGAQRTQQFPVGQRRVW